ncbi:hypothetical protein Poli38472_006061 [Pythium oligandrum]|uniref:Ubiquitin-like domain-containing protein n=1 Tax=Pythium oligandrum TaxID=41045 RepID=A0A8K1FSI8_PYTOL|nr:hypothetical protein Poli38472_006061 [Pythium oligandrum]|eukprot:TMW68593.1 hypothetical protein Poli38472_006061 [Pythium oligandrum]
MDAHEEQLSPRGRDGLDEWTLVDQEAEGMARVVEGTSSTADLEEQNRQGEETRRTSDEISADGEPAIPPGYLQIRVRVGEQVRPAYFKATQHVDDFTTKFFGEELAEGKRIRLIYMGMLLIQDRTMGEYGIEENGVIHVVINDSPPQPHPEASQVVELKGLANPANTLLISTGFILYGLWTLFYHFPHLFSWKAIVLLALLSVVHISATVSRLTT